MYLVDSDVLIAAKNGPYAFDIVPAFWSWLEQQNRAGKLFVVQKVADEILAGGDELSEWVSEQPETFCLGVAASDAAALSTVASWAQGAGYAQGAIATFLSVADYFLVAQALSLGFTVVTHERREPTAKKIKIPNACHGVGVSCMSPYEMLRAEGARFK